MAAEQKQSTLLEAIESHLRQLSPQKLQVVATFLAYLQGREENQAKQELLTIPGFAASFREIVQPEEKEQANLSKDNDLVPALGDNSLNQISQDAEVWQAYLASKKRWQEVSHRLADS
ncbi:hypothetical protein [Mastigocladopsis repens]|uniref:hypothetical protein n=1 Tax=Mastigocladopsis repens TaxID=221287 RepID=UPI0003822986|nr:hypothetical protein [Mastigocladopsis repens]